MTIVVEQFSEDEYQEACENNMGYCPTCKDFTRECTEPDAENYNCEACGGMNVCGAEQALIVGLIDLTD